MTDLDHTLARIRSELAQLRSENRYLRKLADNSGGGRILRRAYGDADTLLTWRFIGMTISRRWAVSAGISERRWAWAIGLLRYARIYDRGDVVARDLETARSQLRLYYHRLRDIDDGQLLTLRARMPRKYRGGARGGAP